MSFYVIKPRSCITSIDKAKKRLKKTVQAYKEGERLLSILQAAKLYVISKTTLYNRIYRRKDQALYSITKQRLILEEKKSIKS